jgi:hypothetical protein
MEHKIIKIDNYLLVVDGSEIKAGDFYLLIPENIVKLSRSGLPINIREWAKIIAHLPLNNSPILEGIDLLPPLEDEVEKLLNDEINYWYHETGSLTSEKIVRRAFSIGLKAKEKYKYTEEDLRKAIEMRKEFQLDQGLIPWYKHQIDDIIKSLQQPKMPVGFECEIDLSKHNGQFQTKYGIKTITNLQGLTQWVGKYIY